MNIALVLFVTILVIWLFYKLLNYGGNKEYSDKEKSEKHSFPSLFKKKDEVKAKKQSFISRLFSAPLPFDDQAITWCANFLVVDKKILIDILRDVSAQYSYFRLGKRSGGYRTISAPNSALLLIQKTIYRRILFSVNIHPAATGFRPNISVANNANAHLGSKQILKIDLADFFGSIKRARIISTFEKIGYPPHISKVLAELCTLNGKLPQGAVTSPTLSNIIAYDMDVKLISLSRENRLMYTRYADDLTFSGEDIPFEPIFSEIEPIVREEKFAIQRKKTRFLTDKKRKIITGISVSSGTKMMIPKSKKREIRKNVHFILTKGLAEHQKFIKSSDPVYLKRIIGYLNFWLMVEPDNEYAKKSITALKKL